MRTDLSDEQLSIVAEISALRFANMQMLSEICELEMMAGECLCRLDAFDESVMNRADQRSHAEFIAQLRELLKEPE